MQSQRKRGILVWGTANPVGVEDNGLAGIYLTDKVRVRLHDVKKTSWFE